MPDLDILYEDKSLLVLNKPAGLPVLPDGWQPNAPYLLRLLEEDFGQPWVVHRLDKTTSGVIVLARSADAHRTLDIQFQRREVRKVYHALVNGHPRWDEHTARHALRADVGHSHRTMVDPARGKPSETHFTVLDRYADAARLEAQPGTGRTHQIRVHAYALGHPLLADLLYGAPPTELIHRPALHALALTFVHPATDQRVTFQAPYPEDFAQAVSALAARG
jgi:tRNA pseudouridine32 synthase / 23S rRNA pseudouridine746 synthase